MRRNIRGEGIAVSILARAEARALLYVHHLIATVVGVSILARAEARALPLHSSVREVWIMFQSSPAPRRGRYSAIIASRLY